MKKPTRFMSNSPEIIETLSAVHATQIFEDGIFNGDCHPGNIMLLDNGKLGLIDFGQVKCISKEQRRNFALVVKAHADMDKAEVVRVHFDVLGNKTKYRKEDIAYLLSSFYVDRDSSDVLQGRNIAEFMEYLEAEDPLVSIDQDLVMACRVSLLLRGLGKAFGIQFRMSEQWEQDAKRCVANYKPPQPVVAAAAAAAASSS